jgi:hypothetical protein
MNHLQDVHTIAERFLKDIESGKVSFYQTPEAVTLPTAEPVVSKVMVMRDCEKRPYLVGMKNNGTMVWAADVRHARSYESDSLTLVNALKAAEKERIKVETFPACWFHA